MPTRCSARPPDRGGGPTTAIRLLAQGHRNPPDRALCGTRPPLIVKLLEIDPEEGRVAGRGPKKGRAVRHRRLPGPQANFLVPGFREGGGRRGQSVLRDRRKRSCRHAPGPRRATNFTLSQPHTPGGTADGGEDPPSAEPRSGGERPPAPSGLNLSGVNLLRSKDGPKILEE